ncbi:MAG TPA: hypothetical protein VFB34_02110, partial [Chloroflexota bacterium]|nr:hypothetical protein [Chloroflexota bacterium]
PNCLLTVRPRTVGPATLARALRENAHRRFSVSSGAWKDIGPSPVNFGGTPPQLDGGRVLSVAYDTKLATLFIGTAGGGVWKSVSPFKSWKPLTDSMPDLAIGALAVDPTDPTGKTIYAGTGETNACGDCMFGVGVYKTTNGGASWIQEGASTIGSRPISRVVVDPVTGDVYASVESFSTGLFMSSNHGSTWANSSNLANDSVSDLQIDSRGDVYADVGMNVSSQGDNGVWECKAPCAAHPTFHKISSGLPASSAAARSKLALATPTALPGSQTLYSIVSSSANSNNILGLYRTTTAGNLQKPPTWTKIGGFSNFEKYEGQAWYNMAITAPDASHLYVSLDNIYQVTSANSKPSFTDLTCVYANNVIGAANTNFCAAGNTVGVHPDQHAIATGPAQTIFFGNDGGIWDTTNGGAAWNDLNGNLSTMQFYAGSLGTPSAAAKGPCSGQCDASEVLGGLQDNGTVMTDNSIGPQWFEAAGGDGFYTALDPINNAFQFEEYTEGQISTTNDFWNQLFSNTTPTACGAGTQSTNFSAPMLEDPAHPATLLAGDLYLCESTNATSLTPTWRNISKGVNANNVSALAISHAAAKTTIYMSDNAGNSWFTTNNGTTWHSMNQAHCTTVSSGPNCAVTMSGGSGLSPSTCGCVTVQGLAADPTTAGVVYAVVNGYQMGSAGHVFRGQVNFSTNAVTWKDISGALPNVPLFTVAVDPKYPHTVFVGGGPGVFVTSGAQTSAPTWQQAGTGMPNANVFDLKINTAGTRVVAFTHGRSAWAYTVPAALL